MERSSISHASGPKPASESSSFLERLGAWRSGSVAEPQRPVQQVAGGSRTKRLVISASRKGGLGKSMFLATLADWYQEHQISFAALDSDWCNGSLTRFVPQARFVDVAGGNPAEDVQQALEENDIVLMDGFGPLQAYLFDWLQECDYFRDFAAPVSLTYVLMVEEDKDSVFQAGEAFRALGTTGQWLVVRNLKTCPTTEIYNASDARQELLRAGALEIQMDRIPWNLLLHLQRAGKTVGAMCEDASLPFLERQRMKSYLGKFFEQVALAQALLLPGSVSPKAEPAHASPAPEPAPVKSKARIAPERV